MQASLQKTPEISADAYKENLGDQAGREKELGLGGENLATALSKVVVYSRGVLEIARAGFGKTYLSCTILGVRNTV